VGLSDAPIASITIDITSRNEKTAAPVQIEQPYGITSQVLDVAADVYHGVGFPFFAVSFSHLISYSSSFGLCLPV
jgi:hypothetical protein